MTTKGNGKTIHWIRHHSSYQYDEWCLIWPFTRIRGYGSFGYMGKRYYAHRFMCELVHGSPPTQKHQAAHSCGMGHLGCVNPRHLSWKTMSENQLDCRKHGTQSKYGGARMPVGTAAQIRELKGVKLQREVAEEFGVSESTVSDIWLGRTHVDSKISYWTAEEDAKLRDALSRGMSFSQTAKLVGRPAGATYGRACRLGLKSAQART
jgi:hypothetical protein